MTLFLTLTTVLFALLTILTIIKLRFLSKKQKENFKLIAELNKVKLEYEAQKKNSATSIISYENIFSLSFIFDVLFENLPSGIVVKNYSKGNRYVYANKSFLEQIGYKKENFIGKKDNAIFPEELLRTFRARDEEILKTNKILSVDCKNIILPNDKVFSGKVTNIVSRAKDGDILIIKIISSASDFASIEDE